MGASLYSEYNALSGRACGAGGRYRGGVNLPFREPGGLVLVIQGRGDRVVEPGQGVNIDVGEVRERRVNAAGELGAVDRKPVTGAGCNNVDFNAAAGARNEEIGNVAGAVDDVTAAAG